MPRHTKQRTRSKALNRLLDWAKLLPLPPVLTGPLIDIAAICCGAGARTFVIPDKLPNGQPLPYSGMEIAGALRQWRGIRVWGNYVMVLINRDLVFTVRGDHARLVEWYLSEHEIPFV